MRKLDYPFIRCVQCEGIALSPRRLCSYCEVHEAIQGVQETIRELATIRGRCTHCRTITVVTQRNLRQHSNHRFSLVCDDCEEGYGSE